MTYLLLVFCARVKGQETIRFASTRAPSSNSCVLAYSSLLFINYCCAFRHVWLVQQIYVEVFGVIWDPMHLYHKDRKQINDAWVRLSGQLDCPVTELNKYVNVIIIRKCTIRCSCNNLNSVHFRSKEKQTWVLNTTMRVTVVTVAEPPRPNLEAERRECSACTRTSSPK